MWVTYIGTGHGHACAAYELVHSTQGEQLLDHMLEYENEYK